jgi:hypothetical protein
MHEDMLNDIHERVIETQIMVRTLIDHNQDKEIRLRSLEASRHKLYGMCGIGVFASLCAAFDNVIEALKRSFH